MDLHARHAERPARRGTHDHQPRIQAALRAETGKPGNWGTADPGNRGTGEPGNRELGNCGPGEPGNWGLGTGGRQESGCAVTRWLHSPVPPVVPAPTSCTITVCA